MPNPRSALLDELRVLASRPEPEFNPGLADDFAATGRRLPYERQYFARRRHLAAVAIIGDEAELASMLEAVCGERSWALPAHWGASDPRCCVDLFASETAQALAEIVASRPDVAGAERVREEIWARVLGPYFDSEDLLDWETAASNWTAVCAGAIGMAALALGEDPDRLRERVLPAMRRYLGSFGPDGGCVEGTDYWVYGFGYFTYFAEAWREATGEDLLAGTEAIAGFPATIQLDAGSFATFGDANPNPMLPLGLLTRLRERLGVEPPALDAIPAFADDHCARWAHLTRTLAWTPSSPHGTSVGEARNLLPDLGWFVERRRLDGRLWALAVKGGHNAEPHNHLDLGSFIIAVDGEQLLTDPGAGEYTGAYFGPARYEQPHPSAAWHSVPSVGGLAQQPGAGSRAAIRPRGGGVELDIDAYGGQRLRRRIEWQGRDISLDDDHPDVESFVSRIRPEIADGTAVWAGERGGLRLHGLGADPAVDRIDAADHHGRPDTLWAVRVPTRGSFRFELL